MALSCPYRHSSCVEEKCSKWNTEKAVCGIDLANGDSSDVLKELKKIKKVLDDILAKP